MVRTLDVYLHTELVGHLIQDDGGQMVFDYNESWLQKSNATPLSLSLPLRSERFKRNECRGFFAGILPDESKREIIAHNLGISARNDHAMLEQIGGECAGAVTCVSTGEQLPERNYGYRTLSSPELAALLKQLPKRPLLAGEDGLRLSLAGTQDKLAAPQAIQNLLAAKEHSKCVTFDTSHLLLQTHPKEALQAIQDFVENLPGESPIKMAA